jgi:hypothetical protein
MINGMQATADSFRCPPRLMPGVDMICIATGCAKMACQAKLLAQALSKS